MYTICIVEFSVNMASEEVTLGIVKLPSRSLMTGEFDYPLSWHSLVNKLPNSGSFLSVVGKDATVGKFAFTNDFNHKVYLFKSSSSQY